MSNSRHLTNQNPRHPWLWFSNTRAVLWAVFLILLTPSIRSASLDWIEVAKDKHGFILQKSGQVFHPWGFNYDHDDAGRLLEDYWDEEWPTVVEDFQEMKALGANVVRIHLQFGKFMESSTRPHQAALRKWDDLIALAERTGLYLDVTGLGCYHKKDVPEWYDALEESDRWSAQAAFWEAVAERGKDSPAVFCYDLMNEPVVPGGSNKQKEWLGPPFAGKHFVQFITRERRERERPDVARQWLDQLAAAVHRADPRHLITVGLVDWSLDRPGLTSGFVPERIAPALDFLCVHLYPEKGKLAVNLETLRGFDVGKPVVIEETFPLRCGIEDFTRFMQESKVTATGWIGFYWGKPLTELRASSTIPDALLAGWLEFFTNNQPKSF